MRGYTFANCWAISYSSILAFKEFDPQGDTFPEDSSHIGTCTLADLGSNRLKFTTFPRRPPFFPIAILCFDFEQQHDFVQVQVTIHSFRATHFPYLSQQGPGDIHPFTLLFCTFGNLLSAPTKNHDNALCHNIHFFVFLFGTIGTITLLTSTITLEVRLLSISPLENSKYPVVDSRTIQLTHYRSARTSRLFRELA